MLGAGRMSRQVVGLICRRERVWLVSALAPSVRAGLGHTVCLYYHPVSCCFIPCCACGVKGGEGAFHVRNPRRGLAIHFVFSLHTMNRWCHIPFLIAIAIFSIISIL